MLLLSQRQAHRLLLIVAALCAAHIVMLSLAPPRHTEWRGSSLVLVAVWSALGATPLPLRWSVAAASLWLIARTAVAVKVSICGASHSPGMFCRTRC